MNSIFEYFSLVEDDFLDELREDWDEYADGGSAENTMLQKQAASMRSFYGSPNDELCYWMKEVAFAAYRVGLKRLTGERPGPDE